MNITQTEAEAILAPFFERITECITSAIEEYKSMDAEKRSKFKKRTRANIINDFMVFNANRELSNMSGILFSNWRGQFNVFIEDKFRLRFKKLDHRLRSSNIPTKPAQKFVNQIPEEMPGMPYPVTNIIAGYQWDNLQIGSQDVFLVCPDGKRNRGELKLSLFAVPGVTVSPTSDSQLLATQTKRVAPKDSDKKF